MHWIRIGFALAALLLIRPRYRRCASGQLLVVYGKMAGGRSHVVTNTGWWVWPIIQAHAFLSLEPIPVPGHGHVRIGDDPQLWEQAAIHLLMLSRDAIAERAGACAPDELAGIGLVRA